jgi:hypothetical protein
MRSGEVVMHDVLLCGRERGAWATSVPALGSALFLVFAVAGSAGCVAFRGGELEELPRVPVRPAPGAPALGYRVICRTNGEPATDKHARMASRR